MIETKLPEGLTLPESNACMTEHKLPVRETGAVFSHIPPFAERLYEMREDAIKTIADPAHVASARLALDMMATFILADLVAPVSSARWVLNEYVGEMRDGKLVELTQPAKISVDAYWDQVNG